MAQEQLMIIGGVGLVVIVIAIVGLFLTRREDDLVERRLGTMDQADDEFVSVAESSAEEGDEPVSLLSDNGSILDDSRELLNPLNNFLAERKFGKNARQKLARANLKLTPAEYMLSHFVAAGGMFSLVFFILSPGEIVTSSIFLFVGWFIPRIYVGRKVSQRLIAFETQLPDTLGLWVNALRSGYSVLQAMEAIAKDAPEPTKTEFQRVVKEVAIGIDMADALDHMLQRVDSPDLDLVMTAVNIQREVGGNLAEILDVISVTIRERIKLKGEIRVLTSQGRITGYLISGLPIILAVFLNLVSPSYMNQMFEHRECGWPMLGGGLALIGIGGALIQKIVDIEI
ncbi:MAG: type II secretion system F family protein [Aggregatilineales bacterium]